MKHLLAILALFAGMDAAAQFKPEINGTIRGKYEYQTEEGEAKRDDEHFVYAAVWEYKGEDAAPELTKEPLNFEFVHPAQRNYKD